MNFNSLWVGIAAVAMSSAWAVTAPPSPPTFYCDQDRPAEADTVEAQFNTIRASGNQTRWEYGKPFSVGANTGDASVPASISSWTSFTLSDLNVGAGVTQPTVDTAVGFQPQAGATAPTVRYFRYRFNLAPTVDAASYQITLSGLLADDQIVGTYLNGVQVSGGAATTVGGGSGAAMQWRPGANELAFAILDTDPAATHLTVQAAAQAVCTLRALPPAAAVPTLHPGALALLGVLISGIGLGLRRRRLT